MIIILLQSLLVTAWIVVLGRVLMSWIDPSAVRPITQFLYRLTEPILGPLRQVLPKSGQLDLSPLVLLLGLGFAMRVILTI
jgi:YggT family protein